MEESGTVAEPGRTVRRAVSSWLAWQLPRSFGPDRKRKHIYVTGKQEEAIAVFRATSRVRGTAQAGEERASGGDGQPVRPPWFHHRVMLRAVVFDFDYTLADSSAGTTECINFALANLGLPAVSPVRACETIGLSLPETFCVLTGIADKAIASRFACFFVQRADTVMEPRTRLYNSVPGTVAALRQRGIALAIVSTKFRYRIANILGRHGLCGQFDAVVGGEDVHDHKPDPSGLLLALAHLGVRPGEAFYVGDHVVDAEAARRAGVPFIAVLSGTCRKEDFAELPVRFFAGSVGDLLLAWDGS